MTVKLTHRHNDLLQERNLASRHTSTRWRHTPCWPLDLRPMYDLDRWRHRTASERLVAASTRLHLMSLRHNTTLASLTYFTLHTSTLNVFSYTLHITCLHPILSCAATSIFLQLYLKPAVHIHCPVVAGLLSSIWPRGVQCPACLAMLSSLITNYDSSEVYCNRQ